MRAAAMLLLLGCGRSSLEEPPDGEVEDGARKDGSIIVSDGGSSADVVDAASEDARPACGPDNCKLCCKPDGTCAEQGSDFTCGTNGEACEVCPPMFHCVKNPNCLKDAPNCGPSNCEGCCWMGAYCLSGVRDILCGHGGQTCLACDTKNGMKCLSQPDGKGGACSGKPLQCSPSNCTGCCYGTICAQGTQDIACGANGVACIDCSASSKLCVARQCQ